MSSDFKNKMLQWEARPPEDAWNRIAASLDGDEEYVLSQKLSSFESQPPQHVWEQIEAKLEAHQPGRVVSFYQKHKLAFKYSGAAAALIFAAFLINLWMSKPSVSNELAQQSNIQNFPQLQKVQSSTDHQNVRTPVTVLSDSQAYSINNSPVVFNSGTGPAIAKHSIKSSNRLGNGYHAVVSDWQQAKDSLVNRYFVHTNNRGEAIRFSNKLYDLFECSDEWTETECAQQIKLWQQKAANSAIYASADFTGVLEILRSMQEGGVSK